MVSKKQQPMRFFLVTFFIFSFGITQGQTFKVSSFFNETNTNGVLNGTILDAEITDEALAFAEISIKNTELNCTSKIDGSFSFNLKPGTYTIIVSFLGYKTVEIENIEVKASEIISKKIALKALKFEPSLSIASLP